MAGCGGGGASARSHRGRTYDGWAVVRDFETRNRAGYSAIACASRHQGRLTSDYELDRFGPRDIALRVEDGDYGEAEVLLSGPTTKGAAGLRDSGLTRKRGSARPQPHGKRSRSAALSFASLTRANACRPLAANPKNGGLRNRPRVADLETACWPSRSSSAYRRLDKRVAPCSGGARLRSPRVPDRSGHHPAWHRRPSGPRRHRYLVACRPCTRAADDDLQASRSRRERP